MMGPLLSPKPDQVAHCLDKRASWQIWQSLPADTFLLCEDTDFWFAQLEGKRFPTRAEWARTTPSYAVLCSGDKLFFRHCGLRVLWRPVKGQCRYNICLGWLERRRVAREAWSFAKINKYLLHHLYCMSLGSASDHGASSPCSLVWHRDPVYG